VIKLLEEIGDLLEVKGELPFKINAYRKAAREIDDLQEDVARVHAEGRLREIPGVGPALEQKISEYLATGQLRYLEKLRAEFPAGLVTLLEVPGLGAKRARMLFESLGVGNLADLEQAAREQRLRDVAGFGEKVESNILRELERLKQRSTRHPLEFGLGMARSILEQLGRAVPLQRAAYAGSLRRMRDTIGDLDLLVVAESPEPVTEAFVRLPRVIDVLSHGPQRASVLLRGGLQADLRVVPAESWGAALQYFSGSQAHNVRLREIAVRRGWTLNEYGLFDSGSALSTSAGVAQARRAEATPR
jgi:DNA polymerase (family X)